MHGRLSSSGKLHGFNASGTPGVARAGSFQGYCLQNCASENGSSAVSALRTCSLLQTLTWTLRTVSASTGAAAGAGAAAAGAPLLAPCRPRAMCRLGGALNHR